MSWERATMARFLLEHPSPESLPTSAKSIAICSDASVVVSEKASEKNKERWWLHGHPHSKRYANPSLTSLGALVRHSGRTYGSNEGFLFPSSVDSSAEYKSMTWENFDRVTESLALLYAAELKLEMRAANVAKKQPTVGLLGRGVTIEYFCTQLALQKLGVKVLLLAESNASNAIHFLLDTCQAVAVITDSGNSKVDTNSVRKIGMVEILPSALQSSYQSADCVKFQDFGDIWERHSFIIHSSGSTGMPKPIFHTNRSMMSIARMYRLFQDFEVNNWFLLFPLYHIAGISVALSNLPNGSILSFPPLAWPPSSSSIFAAWATLSKRGSPVDCIHCAPTLIENMVEYITSTSKDFSPLISLKVLQPGGAALSESILKFLVQAGVNVKTTYGSTETGPPFRTIPHTRSNPKCYTFRNLYPDSPFLKMEEVGEGVYECVVYKGFELAAELWEGKDDREPYRTNDLFFQDAPGSGFYVFQGRKDDILVHSNGENTSAGPLQLDIQSSSKVIHKALALGHSKPYVALLVEVSPGHDTESEEMSEIVWEAVQAVNSRYPKQSQVLRHMIRVLPKGSTLPVTPKGNVRRKEAERIFADIIEELYSDQILDISAPSSQAGPLSDFIRRTLASIIKTDSVGIGEHMTFYELGIDSRLALSLKSALSAHLSRRISLNSIFENPSITKLTTFLSPSPSISTNGGSISPEKPESTQIINSIVSKLEADIRSWPLGSTQTYPIPKNNTILLTGGTGSLGTALLEALSSRPTVEKIYAMVRGSNPQGRLRSSLEERGLDASILDSDKVEVLSFSMRDPLLGLDIDTYHTLANSVTTVIQNAWKMDFNLSVAEFEDDCLFNTMSLLRLAQAGCPKKFAFTSSISTCMGSSSPQSIPESPIGRDPALALSTGYAQSKFIIERVTQTAARELGMNVKLLRVGQMCGHTRTGRWNEDEMWPIMFATSAHERMRCVPMLEGMRVDWIPVDVSAAAISDILLAKSKAEGVYSVYNVTNPRPIPWASLVEMLQYSIGGEGELEEVTMKEWTKRLGALADSGVSPDEVPGLRLLGFFEDMTTNDDAGARKFFETEKTQGVSEALRDCEAFSQNWVQDNVKVWKESGFLK